MGKLSGDSLLESVEMSAVNGPEACEGDRTVLLSTPGGLSPKPDAAAWSSASSRRCTRADTAGAFHAERTQRT